MTLLWAAIIVVAVGAVVFFSIKAGKGWVLVKSESNTKIDRIYRLLAHLKAHGIRTKLNEESGSLRLLARRSEVEQARQLADTFVE